MGNKELWDNILLDLRTTIPGPSFDTWFEHTHIIKQVDGIVWIGVPNTFVKEWLQKKYHTLILKSLRTFSEQIRGIEYAIARIEHKEQPKKQEDQRKNELPLQEFLVDKRDNLNPRYTFDSFIVGPFNELANTAAQAIIRNPGSVYNPFFVHGGTGVGKTHLIQAVGNHLKKEGKQIFYISSEKFFTDFTQLMNEGKLNSFKDKYRKYDVLIMDDVHFFSAKNRMQEELFHIFNEMQDNNKQILFSSDQHPNLIPDIQDRLKSRFSQGMIVNIEHPGYESRLMILKRKAESKNFFPQDQILDFLAASSQVNIRELEGLLNNLMMQYELKKRDITLEDVKVIIRNVGAPKKNVSVKDVVKTVSRFYNVEEEDVYGQTRRKEIVKPRQVAMYLLRECFNISYPTIGEKLGGRDHTTVMHSCEKIKVDMKNNNTLYREVEQLKTLI